MAFDRVPGYNPDNPVGQRMSPTAVAEIKVFTEFATKPRILQWTGAEWPTRSTDTIPTIFTGGTGATDAPAEGIQGDLWFPAVGSPQIYDSGDWIPAMVVSATSKYDESGNSDYRLQDRVNFEGGTYRCIVDHTSDSPTDAPTHWVLDDYTSTTGRAVLTGDPAKARQAIGTLGVPADYDVSGSGDYMANDVVRYTDPDGTSEEDATGLWRCTVDHTSDSPVESPSSWEWVGLTVRPDVPRFIDAGAFPWPQGLVGLWTFQDDRVGRSTVTSKVGSQSVVLMARGSKTVVKDDEDPGPFGPSLVLDGATVFVKDGDLGALDVSKTGDEVTVIAWVKDTAGNHDDTGSTAAAFRGGSHCDGAPPYAARQYGIYFDAHGWPWSKGRLTPHIGAQDGGSPGYTFNRDYAASARKYFTGTGQGQWHMEAMTFDGAQIIAYVDGITDILRAVPEPPATYFGGSHTSLEQVVDRNPFTLRKGINRSATAKRFTIGATVSSPTDGGLSFTTGKLGGIAVFNRALSAQEVMQIRLATLLPDEAVTMCSFEETSEGTHTLLPIGWTAYAGPLCFDVSELMASEYSINRPTGGQKSFLTKVSTAIGVALGPVTGLNSSQLRRVRFKLLSAATASAAQRVLVRVGGTWWASATTFSTSSAHASDTDWSSAESKTLNVNWDAGNWYPVTLTPSLTPTSQSYTNLAQNPALNYYATNWSVSASAPNATGARTSTAGGYVYRLTWTGTDSPDGAGGSLAFSAITGLTAGTNYAVSVVASASKNQLLRAQIYWYAGAVQLSHTDGGVVTVAANTPTTLYVAGTAPATADGMTVKVAPTTAGVSWQSGDTMDISKVLVVAGDSIPAYFDGDTVGATWGGTPGSSTSTFTTTAIGAVYKNLVNNPDLGVNDGNWFISSSAAHATAARTASDGGYVWRLTWTGTDGTVSLGGLSYSAIEAVTAGTTYSASMQIRPSHSNKVTCDLVWYDASNNFLSATVGQVTAVGPNIWSTVRVSGVAPASAAKVSVRVATASGSYVGAQAWRSGYTCDLTHCMLVEGPYLPADYVEGSGPVAVGELSLGGATNTAWIDNALLTAVGVLSSGGDGTAVRITDIELLHTEGA